MRSWRPCGWVLAGLDALEFDATEPTRRRAWRRFKRINSHWQGNAQSVLSGGRGYATVFHDSSGYCVSLPPITEAGFFEL